MLQCLWKQSILRLSQGDESQCWGHKVTKHHTTKQPWQAVHWTQNAKTKDFIDFISRSCVLTKLWQCCLMPYDPGALKWSDTLCCWIVFWVTVGVLQRKCSKSKSTSTINVRWCTLQELIWRFVNMPCTLRLHMGKLAMCAIQQSVPSQAFRWYNKTTLPRPLIFCGYHKYDREYIWPLSFLFTWFFYCFAINIVSKGTLGLLERCVGGWASVGYKFKYNRHLRKYSVG